MQTPVVTSKTNPIKIAEWGAGCMAHSLLHTGGMTVKQETMPAGAKEVLHYHKHSQQYFYILKGTAVFEIDEVIYRLHPGDGIHVTPDQKHRIINKHSEELELLVCSQPSADNDRFNIV